MTEGKRSEVVRLVAQGWSYQLVADACGITRCAVAGIVFRHNHPQDTLVKSPNGRGANKIGTGYTQSSYAPKYSARDFEVRA